MLQKSLLPVFLFLTITLYSQAPQDYLRSHGKDPATYLVEQFNTKRAVLLGEDHAIKQNLDFVTSLIPALYNKGVYNLGMEFGAFEMQHTLDSLLSAPAYNEALAKDMMYYYNVGWAYQEYIDIYKAAWAFNAGLPANARKFRIVNISYQYDWAHYRSGQRTPDNMRQVFYKGTPDKFRAELVDSAVLQRGQKILLLVGTPHAFTRFSPCHYDFSKDNFTECDTNWLGQKLYRKYPGEVATILLHQPFTNYPNEQPWLVSPANGQIEQLMAANNNQPVGFDLGNTPLGQLADKSYHAVGYTDFTIGQIADGYIFLAPFNQLKGCTLVNDFLANRPWDALRQQIPDPDWRGNPASADIFWKQISDFVNISQRYKDVIAP